MFNIWMYSSYFVVFILTLKLIEAKRSKWTNAGNGLNDLKLGGGGGFVRWQLEKFKNATNNTYPGNNFSQEDIQLYKQSLYQLARKTYSNKKTDASTIRCPPLSKTTGVELKCISRSPVPLDPSSHIIFTSDCSNPQEVGTEASYNCEQDYEVSSKLANKNRECKQDGTWTGSGEDYTFSCALECGKQNPVGIVPRNNNDELTHDYPWPWNAAIYVKSSYEFVYYCGGTLINPQVVVTASNCVTHNGSPQLFNVTNLRIDFGRRHSRTKDEYVQSYSAKEILIHPNFSLYGWGSNIAIIILKEAVTMGYHVRPICYLQSPSPLVNLVEGSFGTVVGFVGKYNYQDPNNGQFQTKRLKVVTGSECTNNPEHFFCAGLQNEIYDGAGIYFPVDNGDEGPRWYLEGIAGASYYNFDNDYYKFTKIISFSDWLVRELSARGALF